MTSLLSVLATGLPWSLTIAVAGLWIWLTAAAAERFGRRVATGSALALIAVLAVVVLQMMPPAGARHQPSVSDDFTR